jgi:hypothetical protein
MQEASTVRYHAQPNFLLFALGPTVGMVAGRKHVRVVGQRFFICTTTATTTTTARAPQARLFTTRAGACSSKPNPRANAQHHVR